MGRITVTNVGKAYKVYPTRFARLKEWLLPFAKPRHTIKWVLQDISFSVSPGEAVGIIGINGAGKSTLLKMLTGTTQPTTGTIETQGRVAALLELGIGFHPEFTGRQNAVMAGQLLGLSLDEIQQLMPQIEAFAEIGEYMDHPVRVFSSGMQVRLAFAVAVVRRPDILIVDEALAVGDVYFQQKCHQRIQEYIAEGTTLLFVTHGMSMVLEICTRAIYLQGGAMAFDGSPKEAVDLYQADLLVKQHQSTHKPVIAAKQQVPTILDGGIGSLRTECVTCIDVRLVNALGQHVTVLVSEEHVSLQIRYRIERLLLDPHVGFKIRNKTGTVIFESNTYCMGHFLGPAQAGATLKVNFAFPVDLMQGEYTVTIGLVNEGLAGGVFRESLSYLHDVLSFNVLPNPVGITWDGIINIHPTVAWQWSIAEARS